MDAKFYQCECGGCAVQAWLDDEYQGYDHDPFEHRARIFLSLWKTVARNVIDPFSKWGQIKHILKWGSPYIGDVVLTPSTARALGEELIKLAQDMDQKGE